MVQTWWLLFWNLLIEACSARRDARLRFMLAQIEIKRLEASYLIHDRDTKFSEAVDHLFGSAGIDIIKPPMRPGLSRGVGGSEPLQHSSS